MIQSCLYNLTCYRQNFSIDSINCDCYDTNVFTDGPLSNNEMIKVQSDSNLFINLICQ